MANNWSINKNHTADEAVKIFNSESQSLLKRLKIIREEKINEKIFKIPKGFRRLIKMKRVKLKLV